MALVSMKPTSAGRRHMVKVVHPELHKGKPFAALTEKKNRIDGRDNYGHITTRHKGGGHKRAYRIVDFVRNKDGIPARVERLEYDPNRTAHIALVLFADGERRYIIAPKGLKAGDKLVNGSEAEIKVGNCLPLRNIPVGTTICCVELFPGKGAQLARAAGSYAQLMAREGEYAQVRLRSGEVRPTVRGVAMNPVDHPHGGGEGKTGTGRAPVTPWGQLTRGYRTRNNKRTDNMIVQRRYRK